MCAHTYIHVSHTYAIHTTHMKLKRRRNGEKKEGKEEEEGEEEKFDY